VTWTADSGATTVTWTAGSGATTVSYAAPTRSTIAWAQLSNYTLADPLGDYDFQLVASEQYPLLAVEDRPLIITETGFTAP